MAKKTLAPGPSQAMSGAGMKVSAAPPLRGKLRKKGGATGGYDPSMGTNVNPRNVQERMGSQLRIKVALPGPRAPEAKSTLANGKIVPAVMGQKNNFFGGVASQGNY